MKILCLTLGFLLFLGTLVVASPKPSKFLVGISRHPEKIQMGEPQDLKIVVVDHQGRKVDRGALKVEVLQRSWTYVAKRNDQGDLYWDGAVVWRKSLATQLPLTGGEVAFRFDCGDGGRYLLAFTFTDDKGRTFRSSTFYKVAWKYMSEEERNRPWQPLGLWADRPAYKPGDTAHITLSPKGRVSWYLVTVERDGVFNHQVVKGGQAVTTLPLAIKSINMVEKIGNIRNPLTIIAIFAPIAEIS
jgi:uncharacterized protein YfaS (alpha-2-macroglobulin family)